MDISKLNLFDRVMIHENSQWNNRIGIVDMIKDGVVYLITVQDPVHHYEVGIWNANNITPLN